MTWLWFYWVSIYISQFGVTNIFFSSIFLWFKYSRLHFHPTRPPCLPFSTSHPQSYSPLALSVGPSYMFLDDPSHSFPCYPSPCPSGYCQFALYFNVTGYILLACLFCWLGSTYRWDHMVFVFHHLAYFTFSSSMTS